MLRSFIIPKKTKINLSLSSKFLLFPLIASLVLIQNNIFAQDEAELFTAKNAIYAEVGGNSSLYALNYSRIFHQKGRLKISASAGLSMRYTKASEPIYPSFWSPSLSSEITAFLGKSRHHVEFGTGFLTSQNRDFIFDTNYQNNIREQVYWDQFITGRIGYRYQKPDGGFFFRAGYTPVLVFYKSEGADNGAEFYPVRFGISAGISF